MSITAIAAPRIFDGSSWHEDCAILFDNQTVHSIVPRGGDHRGAELVELEGGMIVPGFIDIQVNGGGGILLNDDPSVAGIRRICAAHRVFGTTAMLPTLISDTPGITSSAIKAGIDAQRDRVPGFAGLHLEGPHLSVARKGAHSPALIRPMNNSDLAGLMAAKQSLETLMTTVAAETVSPDQIARLSGAGLRVSLGHSDADARTARAAFAAGASMVTHLFNAMSQIGNREPGLVGAALAEGVWASLIADGIHVHPTVIDLALRAHHGPGHIVLVTDAMAQIGTDMTRFRLNGTDVIRKDGALRLPDGTLAGADLTMIDAIRFMHQTVGTSLDETLRMASLYPAQAIGRSGRLGHLGQGAEASLVHLTSELEVREVWIQGTRAAQSCNAI